MDIPAEDALNALVDEAALLINTTAEPTLQFYQREIAPLVLLANHCLTVDTITIEELRASGLHPSKVLRFR